MSSLVSQVVALALDFGRGKGTLGRPLEEGLRGLKRSALNYEELGAKNYSRTQAYSITNWRALASSASPAGAMKARSRNDNTSLLVCTDSVTEPLK